MIHKLCNETQKFTHDISLVSYVLNQDITYHATKSQESWRVNTTALSPTWIILAKTDKKDFTNI